MKSDKWDYEKQQLELMIRFWLFKLKERDEEMLREIKEGMKKTEEIYNLAPSSETLKSLNKYKKLISHFKKSQLMHEEVFLKTKKIVDEEFWDKSLSCVGCHNSFKNTDDLLDHVKIHLIKLNIIPKNMDEDKD
jgi:rRNA maturation endonuclease Nob1